MEKSLPIYSESRQTIINLQHVSFVVTKLFFFFSGSKITITEDWTPEPGKRYVIASNHVGWGDPFVVTTALGWKRLMPILPCRFIAAPVFMSKWWLRGPMRKLGSYPSHPYKDWPYGIEASIYLLEHKSTIVIFPQGKRTRDRTLPAKRGVGMLAERDNVEVIPVFMVRHGKTFSRYVITVGSPQNMSHLSPDEIMGKVFELDRER